MDKKYNIIYADPPWEYKVWSKKGKGRSAENHYKTQSVEDMKVLNVPSICANDCALFMWATFPCLKEAFVLANAWGFIYKTVAFVWIKVNRNNNTFFTGLGYYTRANAEIVMLFIKGRPLQRVSKNVEQVVISKVGPHSQKPDEVRKRIVRLFGELPRVELFARSRRGFFPDVEYSGWDVYGDQTNHSIHIPVKK